MNFPYKSHFSALRKGARSKDLKELIEVFEYSDIIQGDKKSVIGALTYIGNQALDLGEEDIVKRARGIRDMIRNTE